MLFAVVIGLLMAGLFRREERAKAAASVQLPDTPAEGPGLGKKSLFLGAMATSSHISIVLYLASFLTIALVVLAAFAHLHVLAGIDRGRTEHATPQRAGDAGRHDVLP